jgi:hypothetical protein
MRERRAAYNEQYHKMATVSPQTILCEFERLSPTGTSVEDATSQIQYDNIPFLLRYFMNTVEYQHYKEINFEEEMRTLNPQHFLNEKELELLTKELNIK